MLGAEIFLIVETVDRYRWIGVVEGREDVLRALVKMRNRPAAGSLPPIPVEWIPETLNREVCDFPIFMTTLKCTSRPARHVLDDLLTPNGEWLALDGLDGEYSAFHCLREVECLDIDAVEAEKRRAPDFSFHSATFVPRLRRDSVQPCNVFRVPQSVNKFFVSREFALRYEEHGFKGLDFLPVTLS